MNTDARLSELFRDYPNAVEAIVALNEHDFARLRNPFLRKIMSPRITLNRVATMVGMSGEDFARYLREHGCDVESTEAQLPTSAMEKPEWWQPPAFWVDLLPIDDAAQDPMPPIMLGMKDLRPGDVMGIRHRWEPQPLFDVWTKLGVQYWTQKQNENEWHIFVRK